MTCDAWNCLFPNSDLLRSSHRLQLPVFLSAAIRQPDTKVQPNSHLLQSQEHNVQIKKVENSLCLISMRWLPVHLLACEWKFWHSGTFRNMRMVLFRQCAVLTAMREVRMGGGGGGTLNPASCALWLQGRSGCREEGIDSGSSSLPAESTHYRHVWSAHSRIVYECL